MRRLVRVNADHFFAVFIPVAVTLTILVAVVVQGKKSKANLAALAAQLAFTPKTTGRIFKKTRLVGELRGKPAEIFTYTTGSGKSQRCWAAVAVQVKETGGLTFSLEPRMAIFDVIARMFRKGEAKTGDDSFDHQWVLKTNQPQFMEAALLPEMRLKLKHYIDNGFSAPNFGLETSWVRFAEQGTFSSKKTCQHLVESAELVCDLADMVEVGAEMQKRRS